MIQINLNEKFDTLLKKKLRPSEHEKREIRKVTNRLHQFMTTDTELPISTTHIGGSFGKNTMLKNRREVDLVFFLSHKLDATRLDPILNYLLKRIGQIFPKAGAEKRRKAISLAYHNIEIDLLPALQADSPINFQLLNEEEQILYKTGLSKWHVQFCKKQGQFYQDNVRIVKYWVQRQPNKPKSGYCSSFLLELLVAFIYDQYQPRTYKDSFLNFLNWIVDTELDVTIAFEDFYYYNQLPAKKWEGLSVYDPGIPWNDVAVSFTKEETFLNYTRYTLNRIEEDAWHTIFGPPF